MSKQFKNILRVLFFLSVLLILIIFSIKEKEEEQRKGPDWVEEYGVLYSEFYHVEAKLAYFVPFKIVEGDTLWTNINIRVTQHWSRDKPRNHLNIY